MATPLATLEVTPIEVEAGGSDALDQRRSRRAYLAPEFLRTHKVSAGEWVFLRSKVVADGVQGWIVAQAWPRVGLEEDGK